MQILLKYLQRDRHTVVWDGEVSLFDPSQPIEADITVQIIKVLSSAEQQAADIGITEAEKGILQVKSTSQALETQIQDLESRIAQ